MDEKTFSDHLIKYIAENHKKQNEHEKELNEKFTTLYLDYVTKMSNCQAIIIAQQNMIVSQVNIIKSQNQLLLKLATKRRARRTTPYTL